MRAPARSRGRAPIGDALTKLKAAFADGDLLTALEAKTEFYAALIGGCQNAFIERMLKPLHDRITLLRITSMSQPKRINKSLREVTAIWRAIQSGDPDLAEKCCVDHINAAAVAALSMIEQIVRVERKGDGGRMTLHPFESTNKKRQGGDRKRP